MEPLLIKDLKPGDRFWLANELRFPVEWRTLYQFEGIGERFALIRVVREDGTVGNLHRYNLHETVRKQEET